MFGRSRRGAPFAFLLGLSLMGWGAGSDMIWLFVGGVALFAVGIALLARRRSEFSPY
jgi:LPXTG-motif cell wall-anchored protein